MYLAIRAEFDLVVFGALRGDGPVDKEEVDVVEFEFLEGVLQRPFDYGELG